VSRLCFVSDDSDHWYALPVRKRLRFNELLAKLESGNDLTDEEWREWSREFEPYKLNMHISSYSFKDLKEI